MISREDTWHPRYGVLPGYGISLQDGFQDTFTATATAALEWGAFPYAKGVIDNHFRFYVQPNGGSTYRAEEVAVSSRMLTILALYASYTGDDDFLVSHFAKAEALGNWCLYRYNISLEYPASDPRHGIPGGDDEADTYIGIMYGDGTDWPHWYSSAGEMYRGFAELGKVWRRIGKAANRQDIAEHGAKLLAAVPGLLKSARASIATNTFETGDPLFPRCYSTRADQVDPSKPVCNDPTDFRAVPEMLYSGILSRQQVDDIYMYHAHSQTGTYRPMTMGCTGYNNKQTTYIAYGMAYGLLQHDMVERFLLHFFAMAAHTYTRGTWTTPEACSPDKDVASTAYVAAGVVTAPVYLKWALVFEEPENQTVWVGKAVPRDWFGPGETPLVAAGVPTRYGDISFTFTPPAASQRGSGGNFVMTASVQVSETFATSALTTPAGGLRIRFRVPSAHAGKLLSATVGGKPWTDIDAAAQTVDFAAGKLAAAAKGGLLANIVATFAAAADDTEAATSLL